MSAASREQRERQYQAQLAADSRERSCEAKQRYTDEHVARAVGIHQMSLHGRQLYFYPCPHCRGCHLTCKPRAAYYAVDYYEKKK